jgi:hypothetical protein
LFFEKQSEKTADYPDNEKAAAQYPATEAKHRYKKKEESPGINHGKIYPIQNQEKGEIRVQKNARHRKFRAGLRCAARSSYYR